MSDSVNTSWGIKQFSVLMHAYTAIGYMYEWFTDEGENLTVINHDK